MAVAHFPLVSVTIEREAIPVDTLVPSRVPDEKWRHIDAEGHVHCWVGDQLPTLEWVVTGTEWVGDEYGGDEYEVGEYRCPLCAETVKPGERLEYGPRSVPGVVTVQVVVNGESFVLTQDEYARSVDGWAGVLRTIRAERLVDEGAGLRHLGGFGPDWHDAESLLEP